MRSSKVFGPDEEDPKISISLTIGIRWIVNCIETSVVVNLELEIKQVAEGCYTHGRSGFHDVVIEIAV